MPVNDRVYRASYSYNMFRADRQAALLTLRVYDEGRWVEVMNDKHVTAISVGVAGTDTVFLERIHVLPACKRKGFGRLAIAIIAQDPPWGGIFRGIAVDPTYGSASVTRFFRTCGFEKCRDSWCTWLLRLPS